VPATETNQDERLKSPQIIQGTKATRYPQAGTRRAKAQEDGQANGLLSVKLLDSDGNETGEAFDVFAFADQSATDMAD